MKLFAIGDLHLSTSIDKPMNIFGENWHKHEKKIFSDWQNRVSEEDIVLVVGDISWASKLDDAMLDLNKIYKLNGKKYFIKGNHDYWWTTASALNKKFDDTMIFMNTSFQVIGSYALCGTRGWTTPNDIRFEENDQKIYKREANRLRISLESAKKSGFEKIIVIIHYPPSNEEGDNTLFKEIIDEYKVEHVIYGHLHGQESFEYGIKGLHNNTKYHLVSCDYLDFKLKEIEEIKLD